MEGVDDGCWSEIMSNKRSDFSPSQQAIPQEAESGNT
jgi:hypothetical protein